MINDAYQRGRARALTHFKIADALQGAAGRNPMLAGQAATTAPPPTTASPPASPATPIAAGAHKATVLG